MNESIVIGKDVDAKKGFSSARRNDKSIQRVRDEPERKLGALGGVIGNIRRDGAAPSAESIATELCSRSATERAPALLALQQTHGNQYVQRVVAGIQAKLTVGQPGDKYEQEADRVADAVMRMPDPRVQRQIEPEEEEEELIQTKPLAEQITQRVQRQVEPEEEEEEELIQTKALEQITPSVQRQEEEEEEEIQTKPLPSQTSEVVSDVETSINSIRGGGQPLPGSTRAFFEPRFGQDFGQVRLHTGAQAAESARALNARAFTVGQDVVFGAGQYAPGTGDGRRLLAHEMTHVVQQTASHTFHPSVQLEEELIPSEFLPMVSSAVGDLIVSEARSRMANSYIRRAYSSRIPWFFSPNNGLAGWASKNDIMEAARLRRRVGNATRWMKSSMVRRMPGLGRELENFPSGEGVVWWGWVYTCNVFVFDVLYQAGLNPPLLGNAHYYNPIRIFNRSGALRSYFSDISAENIQPGDVFATRGHTEIVTSTSSETTVRRGRRTVSIRTFSSIGAGKDGVGVEESSGVRTVGKVFRRVGSEVLETHVGVA